MPKLLDKEKNEKTIELVESWRQSIREHLDQVKRKIALMESCDFLFEKTNQEAYEKFKKEKAGQVAELKQIYEEAERMFSENKLTQLLNAFGMAQLGNPMLSANYDDEKAMRALINVFGAKALNDWDGDTLNRYARIEVEKKYSGMVGL